MNRKIVLLNIVLLALVVWLGLRLRDNWLESKAKQQAAIGRDPKAVPTPQPPALPGAPQVSAVEYLNVAQQTLFSEDRNSIEILAPPPTPPPPPPEIPVPPFPHYHGQMALSEPVIVLSTNDAKQKSYHVGDQVGEFKIAAFDRESITLEWNNKTLQPLLKTLVAKEKEEVKVASQAPSTPAPQSGPIVNTAIGGQSKDEGQFGEASGQYRQCLMGDKSPDGTVKDGFRKKIVGTLMGESCHWEPIK